MLHQVHCGILNVGLRWRTLQAGAPFRNRHAISICFIVGKLQLGFHKVFMKFKCMGIGLALIGLKVCLL